MEPDAQISRQMRKLETMVKSQNLAFPDPRYGALVAAKAELMNSQPNLGYVREILRRALKK